MKKLLSITFIALMVFSLATQDKAFASQDKLPEIMSIKTTSVSK